MRFVAALRREGFPLYLRKALPGNEQPRYGLLRNGASWAIPGAGRTIPHATVLLQGCTVVSMSS